MARYVALALSVLGFALSAIVPDKARGAEFSTPEAGHRFFENRIRPLLADHCYGCHGEDAQESALRLDHWQGLSEGGGSGPLFKPGAPEQSLLMAAVRYQDDSLQMPPDEKLSDRQIADLEQWIAAGAPHPEADAAPAAPAPRRAGDDLWSFQPRTAVELPEVADRQWPTSPVDYFILAQLEAADLEPAPPADRATLLRRVTYDLTGLPPTPEQLADFVADERPDAYARLVDRLLASPEYGERWGRHWLDVARYADSNGLDENVAHGNAWRYRDWVVAALNCDQPYDQFVVEQLAGDLLPSEGTRQRYDRLIATGFLSLGPKVLAEVDKTKMEMDIIDEQLDTAGRAFLGLTFGCARCHDHKFDPISAEDYYALAGIFKSTRTMESLVTIARWNEHEIPTAEERQQQEAHAAKLNEQNQRLATQLAAATAALQEQLGAGAAMPENPEEHFPEETREQLKELREEIAELEKSPPEVSAAMGVAEGTPEDLAVHLRGSHLSLGAVVPRRFLTALNSPTDPPEIPQQESGRLQLAQWITDPEHPLTARVMVNRLWRWHFGRGLVDSPDNFGQLGSRPTHPELLDWLANRFIEQRWSLKRMHRLLLLSSTYRMSSEEDTAGRQHDPDNRLAWRAPLRRLEAEAIRDSLLAVSDQLDRRMGGSQLHVKNREFFFDHTSKDTTSYDSSRRSVYLPIVRNNMYAAFELFDYTDSTVLVGDRTETVVSTQALFMMNSDLVSEAASRLAERTTAADDDDAQRLQSLYRRLFTREATGDEIDAALADLDQLERIHRSEDRADPRQQAWITLCHALLASNEFIYLR